MRQELDELALILVFGLPLAVAIAGLGGYTLARRALLPVERMTERARTITAERLSDRLPVENPDDEMGRLAVVFNETLGRLEASFEQMRRFTADVSHRAAHAADRDSQRRRSRACAAIATSRRIADDHRQHARGSRSACRVSSIGCSTLSRAETRQAKLSPDEFDVARARRRGGSPSRRAGGGEAAVHRGRTGGAPHAYADRLVVRQALINLVDNAIKFSPPAERIRIRVTENAERSRSSTSSTADPGIEPSARERIFDRFYRGDGRETAAAPDSACRSPRARSRRPAAVSRSPLGRRRHHVPHCAAARRSSASGARGLIRTDCHKARHLR